MKIQKHTLGEASIKIVLNLTKIKNTHEDKPFRQFFFQKHNQGEASWKIMFNFQIRSKDGSFCKKNILEKIINVNLGYQSQHSLVILIISEQVIQSRKAKQIWVSNLRK